jgi:membrane-bound lytic murein transglycosylase B
LDIPLLSLQQHFLCPDFLLPRFSIFSLLIALFAPALAFGAAPQDFASWLEELRAQALEEGIFPATLDLALKDLQPLPQVIELDRKQPEKTQSLAQYLAQRLSPALVETARLQYQAHPDLLERIGAQYRVQPRFIVALWGLESHFGRQTGSIPVIAALATLAYDGRRSRYFRQELLAALSILDQGHVAPEHMTGSWAGAMGQCQFMPSSYVRLAVDHDGDGRRDIWGSQPDVFASIANFLAQLGWRDDLTWGRPVRLPPDLDPALLRGKVCKDLQAWQELGVRCLDGSHLPGRQVPARLLRPSRSGGRAYVVYANFDVLMQWNNSSYFGIAVGSLADALATP